MSFNNVSIMPSHLYWKLLNRSLKDLYPRRPRRYWALGLLLVLVAVTELGLRVGFGLGNPVLLQADPYTGYRFQPNQRVVRFGKRISYNQFSQRSQPITLPKPPSVLRLLMVGDSVLNGGNPTDQSETITELFQTLVQSTGQPAEVLNASAGSWGIGNQLGYLQQFGIFDSDAVVLQIGAHDLYQPTSTSEKLGRDPNFPDRRPLLAIQELWVRYLLPRLHQQFAGSMPITAISPSFDPTITALRNRQHLSAAINLVQAHRRPVFILFIPGYPQVVSPVAPTPYKAEFLQVVQSLNAPIIDMQLRWQALPPATIASYFRDEVHLTVAGHRVIATALYEGICQHPSQSICRQSQDLSIFQ
jgi:lysophospholipase L1-like esterase